MSACAAVFHLDGKPAEEEEIRVLLAQMAYRGGDGEYFELMENLALGFQHQCVLPEDVEITWPVWNREQGIGLVFDGRLDNREELARELGINHTLDSVPDARLVLSAYREWADGAFERFIGPYSLVLFESASQSIVLARDALGDRKLCYAYLGNSLLVASDEQALLAFPGMSRERNESRLALYFAGERPVNSDTYFEEIHHLLPAHYLRVSPRQKNSEQRQYWRLKRSTEWWRCEPGEIEEEFRNRLSKAVSARSRGIGRSAISLSGGLDSTSIVAAAAESVPADGTMPVAFSYVFDRFAKSDEREYLGDMYNRFDLEHVQVNGDQCWPLYEDARFEHHSVNEIVLDMMAGLRKGVFDQVQARGHRTLLAGDYGDQLFEGYMYWLRDLLANGEVRKAVSGFRKLLSSGRSVNSVLRRVLPFNGWRRHKNRNRRAEWLTPGALELLPDIPKSDPLLGVSWEQDRFEQAVNLQLAQMSSHWHAEAQRWNIDLRLPYRDRRVVEFAVGLPAYYLFDPEKSLSRPVVRNAYRGRLPDSVTRRPGKSGYGELMREGLYVQEREKVNRTLQWNGGKWRRYVNEDWLTEQVNAKNPESGTVLWLCLCFQMWDNALIRNGK